MGAPAAQLGRNIDWSKHSRHDCSVLSIELPELLNDLQACKVPIPW